MEIALELIPVKRHTRILRYDCKLSFESHLNTAYKKLVTNYLPLLERLIIFLNKHLEQYESL